MNQRKAVKMAERRALDRMHEIYNENLRQARILQMLMDARDTSTDALALNASNGAESDQLGSNKKAKPKKQKLQTIQEGEEDEDS